MGVIYAWMDSMKERENKLEAILLFFQKSMGVMETENMRVIDYFEKYASQNREANGKSQVLAELLLEIAKQLRTNTYPHGQMVWEHVFRKGERTLSFDIETFHIILQGGNGFFGKSKEENIRFLRKSIKELEIQEKRMKEKNRKEKKVWIPVGMLGAVMLIILFL